MNDEQMRMRQFMLELTKLTRKYGVAISGCGCCGSPFLRYDADVSNSRAGYATSEGYEDLQWIAPSDDYYWGKYSKNIIREDTNAAS
jgi:hypothetical protein